MEVSDSSVVNHAGELTDVPAPSLLAHRPSFSFATDGYFTALGNYPAPSITTPLQPLMPMPTLQPLQPLPPGLVNGVSPHLMHRSSWSVPTHLGLAHPTDPHPLAHNSGDGDGGEVYHQQNIHNAQPEIEEDRSETKTEETSDEDKRHWGTGRKKIQIEFIQNKLKRQITFSKRKTGMMKKIQELTTLTGTQALLVLVSETGHVYNYATPKLLSLVADDDNNPIRNALRAWNVETKQYRDMA